MEKEVQELVRQSSLFKDVRPDVFAQVLETSMMRSVEEDGFFFLQGDSATHAYVLVEGRVKMIQITPNGQQITMRILTPGQTYGGIALLNPRAGYPATKNRGSQINLFSISLDFQYLLYCKARSVDFC